MNLEENQRCSCTIAIQGSRKLSPIVVWSFYTATFLGLLTSIIIICAKNNNSEEADNQSKLLKILIPLKEDKQSEDLLDSLILYQSLLNEKPKNISWIDGSNDEIYYKDPESDVVILNVAALEKSQSRIQNRINVRKSSKQDLCFHHTNFKAENFIISPDKLYIAELWDVQKSFTESEKYKVIIKEFNSGAEKIIVKNNNFVSQFSFSKKNNLYFYVYTDKEIQEHYKCFLNHADFNKTREFCQIKLIEINPDSLNEKKIFIDENSVLYDSMIDGIIYKEKGSFLLYPRINRFSYRRAFTIFSPEIKRFKKKLLRENYERGFSSLKNEKKNRMQKNYQDIQNFSSDFHERDENWSTMSEEKQFSKIGESNLLITKPEIIYFGLNQINYFDLEENDFVSVEFTIHYPHESAVFYKLQSKNNSYYFPSRRKSFFINPASGIIQLDSKPWILHPFVFQNKTSCRSTFNIAISTNNGVNQKYQDIHFQKLFSTFTENNFVPLLSSEYYVTEILKVRKDKRMGDLFAYFIAAPTRNVSRSCRNFYKIKIQYPPVEKISTEPVICLTCPDEKSDGGLEKSKIYPQCLWADVKMSSLGDYYLLRCKGPDVPWTVIVSTQTNRIFYNLKENENIRAWDSSVKKPRIHEFEFELHNGFSGRVRMYFPFEWHPEIKKCSRKYNLLLHVDGTPEGQLVTAKYQISWLWYLILNKHFIVVEADVRGSGYQSIEMSSEIWRNIGTFEIQDQIAVVKFILKKFNCLDLNQVAVYGKAYGGYTALNLMAMDFENIFKCCAAVSPITTWQHYSHDFVIKLFGGEYNNITKSNYENANLAGRVHGLRNKNFIIYSATMDQEILKYHVQNLIILLTENGIYFKHQQYIDQGHDFSKYRSHLYKHIYQYFINCFAKKN